MRAGKFFKTPKLKGLDKLRRLGLMRKHELTQTQWKKIKGLLPAEKKPHAGRPAKDNRAMLHAMIYWLNTGVAWRDLPERFGPWQSVYTRLRRWSDKGVWTPVLNELIKLNIVEQSQHEVSKALVNKK